jgi:hypothetical protein
MDNRQVMDQMNDVRLHSYIDVLEAKAKRLDIRLLDAFKWKDIPTSTYYRNVKREVDMKYAVAFKVNAALHELHDLREHRRNLRSAQQNNHPLRKKPPVDV